MFATERLNIIKSFLREHRRVDVHSLSEVLNVSEVTIRRDLEKLEADGFLRRIHGGAVPVEPPEWPDLPGPPSPAGQEDPEAAAMAAVAALMIHDGDVVAILNGSLMPAVAKALDRHKGLTILTNHLAVAETLRGQPQNRTVILGGTLDPPSQAVFGSLTVQNLRNYFVNHLLVEVDGVSENLHLTLDNQEKADLVREAMACADTRIALCRPDHFGRNAFFRLGSASDMNRIISAPDLADTFKERLFSRGIPLYTSIQAWEGGP